MKNERSRRIPKQTRSQERYGKILEAASRLFLENGFDGTSTNEIARQAGMSIGSLYQYFADKKAIVRALASRYVEALRGVMDEMAAADPGDLETETSVDRLLDPIVTFHMTFPAFRRLWLAADASPELQASLRAVDEEVLGRVRRLLEARVPGIPADRARTIVTLLGLNVKSLIGLLGRSDDPGVRREAVAETKRMLVAYMEDVLRESAAGGRS